MRLHMEFDIEVDDSLVPDEASKDAFRHGLREDLMQMAALMAVPKRPLESMDFSDPARKPSFKEFLLNMPDGDLDYEMGVKAPE